LRLVHRQLQLRHHVPHRGEGFSGLAPTTDHEVIGVVHDVRSETPLVSQLLPAEHEPAHVQIAEQGTDHAAYTKGTFDLLGRRIPRFGANTKESECCDEW